MDSRDILRQPIGELDLSPDFKERTARMGVEVLESILSMTPAELLSLPDFSYAWLAELSAFLQERGLFHLLQSTPGKSYG